MCIKTDWTNHIQLLYFGVNRWINVSGNYQKSYNKRTCSKETSSFQIETSSVSFHSTEENKLIYGTLSLSIIIFRYDCELVSKDRHNNKTTNLQYVFSQSHCVSGALGRMWVNFWELFVCKEISFDPDITKISVYVANSPLLLHYLQTEFCLCVNHSRCDEKLDCTLLVSHSGLSFTCKLL